MKKFCALLLAAFLLVGTMCSASAKRNHYTPGDTVSDFTVTLQDGTVANLNTLLQTKKAVVINIWATWCGPCRAEFPYMNRAYDQYKDDIALLCLSPFDSNADITAFMQQNGLTLPMGNDSAKLGDQLVTEGYPTTVVIDQNGTYVYYECGSMLSVAEFTNLFAYILNPNRVPGEVFYEVPEASEAYEASNATYTVRVVDENGTPVTGVLVNVCTDAFCNPAMVDANGVLTFTSDPCTYDIHVLVAPSGFAFDTNTGYELPAVGGEVVITLQHK